MPTVWAIGAGAGLATLAGLRLYIPLAVFVLFSRLGWVWEFKTRVTPVDFMHSNGAIAVLLVLIVLEVAMGALPLVARFGLFLRLPLAVAGGALLMVAPVSGEVDWPVYLAALPAGAVLALVGMYVRQGLTLSAGRVGSGASPGPALDFSVLVLSVSMMLLPPAGYPVLLLTLWLALRVRRLRKLKYRGLRVLV